MPLFHTRSHEDVFERTLRGFLAGREDGGQRPRDLLPHALSRGLGDEQLVDRIQDASVSASVAALSCLDQLVDARDEAPIGDVARDASRKGDLGIACRRGIETRTEVGDPRGTR